MPSTQKTQLPTSAHLTFPPSSTLPVREHTLHTVTETLGITTEQLKQKGRFLTLLSKSLLSPAYLELITLLGRGADHSVVTLCSLNREERILLERLLIGCVTGIKYAAAMDATKHFPMFQAVPSTKGCLVPVSVILRLSVLSHQLPSTSTEFKLLKSLEERIYRPKHEGAAEGLEALK